MAVRSSAAIVTAILVAAVLIAAAVIFAPTIRENIFHVGFGEMEGCKRAVAGQLIDPDSAKFRNNKKMPLGGCCGEINGKNRFGAYVGFKKFHTRKDTTGDWIVAMDPSIVDIFCK